MVCYIKEKSMTTMGSWIAEKTPKFNKQIAEGFCYHRLKNTIKYIDNFIKYTLQSKTNTHLRYLGYAEVPTKEEMKLLLQKTTKVVYDVAENSIYLVKFQFQYGDEPEPREHYLYLPYLDRGNTMYMSGNKFLVMPVLSDKVISVGENVVFINILTAKYNFTRSYSTVKENGIYKRVPIINTELYKNQAKKLEDTTKANTTVMHYLLANYGYSKTMQMLLGFVPTPVYDHAEDDSVVIIESNGTAPHGYIGDKKIYEKSNLKFVIKKEQYNETVLYCLGNMYYIIDNFVSDINAANLDETLVWKRLLGEIIHSGNHGLSYLSEKINAHFNDINSNLDAVTVTKLKDVGTSATSLMELLVNIFTSFNAWMMLPDSRSLYYNKSYEVESFVLCNLTSRITRLALDINKEELRTDGQLDRKQIDKLFGKYFAMRAIFGIKKEKQYITSVDYSGDHLYYKNTAMVVQQESDPININKSEVNTSERKKMIASAATVGSIYGLSKKNPNPLIRVNPYVNVDFATGTVLPHEHLNHIVEATDKLLAAVGSYEDAEEGDEIEADMLNEFEDNSEPTEDYDDTSEGDYLVDID